jgi:hypothetical protein
MKNCQEKLPIVRYFGFHQPQNTFTKFDGRPAALYRGFTLLYFMYEIFLCMLLHVFGFQQGDRRRKTYGVLTLLAMTLTPNFPKYPVLFGYVALKIVEGLMCFRINFNRKSELQYRLK